MNDCYLNSHIKLFHDLVGHLLKSFMAFLGANELMRQYPSPLELTYNRSYWVYNNNLIIFFFL